MRKKWIWAIAGAVCLIGTIVVGVAVNKTQAAGAGSSDENVVTEHHSYFYDAEGNIYDDPASQGGSFSEPVSSQDYVPTEYVPGEIQ